MHKDLIRAFDAMVERLKGDIRCKGGWHYGSAGRGGNDVYSDFDPVFLFDNKDFEAFANDVPDIIAFTCDQLLICWPENYNDKYFKNFCSVIRMGGNLHELDFFMLNADHTEQWMCRQHLKGCTRENIIFDRNGEVGALLDKGLRTDNAVPDTVRALDTYWFHIIMLIKHFKRKDIFKLLKNVDIAFHAHVDLLLSYYDTLDWGGWESKINHCVPEEKKLHLKEYFVRADFDEIKRATKTFMILFRQDAYEICGKKGIGYPDGIAEQTIAYFDKRLSSDAQDWENGE